ncbi:CDP-archaeol synthase [Rhodovastum atsumiense]|uniref:CDP-archaeol synthase n=1 Tax=Rhodovastum atsumiense TaxID=504468 RepID=A0A5M6J1Z3_9PROT|nr:CDP-archaeol synthase [Rhodovastum atsumiense]KAA5614612.1 CDP-archaeol synthase [Rhodovastum atsumiense]CAH2599880.1 CDP-archaeol synthase [Rhodovastum atsumiense]
MDHRLLLLSVLFLLMVANGAPILAGKLVGGRFAAPIDRGLRWRDGRSLFGASKTFRGVAASIGATAVAALPVGLDWISGAALAAAAMAGDLFASFLKRRLAIPLHGEVFGLDQIPEALLPLLLLRLRLGLSWLDVAEVALMFVALQIVLSRALFHLRIRDRPH